MHSVASDGEVIFHSLAVGDLVEASQKEDYYLFKCRQIENKKREVIIKIKDKNENVRTEIFNKHNWFKRNLVFGKKNLSDILQSENNSVKLDSNETEISQIQFKIRRTKELFNCKISDEWVAFLMINERRLGAKSPFRGLPSIIFRKIFEFLQNEKTKLSITNYGKRGTFIKHLNPQEKELNLFDLFRINDVYFYVKSIQKKEMPLLELALFDFDKNNQIIQKKSHLILVSATEKEERNIFYWNSLLLSFSFKNSNWYLNQEKNGAQIWKSITNFAILKKRQTLQKYELNKNDVIKIADYEISIKIEEETRTF